jgi:hypothetical protein
MTFLIPIEQLQAAHKRIAEREQAAKQSSPAPAFRYQPRTLEQWQRRADQTRTGPAAIEPVSPAVAPCGGFVETRRQYVCCKTCGHWRSRHCTKRVVRKGAEPRRQSWEITDSGAVRREADKWRGFMDENGQVRACQHTPEDASVNYACTSTNCAEVAPDGETFCPCDKFVNPLARPRAKAAKPRTPSATPRKSKKPPQTLVEVQLELFQLEAAPEESEPLNRR